MGHNIEGRLKTLEDATPNGYRTTDSEGNVVIESKLPALAWFRWATKLFHGRGRRAEKDELRKQLARSVGPDGGGGYLYQIIAAQASGPEKTERGDES